MRLFNLQDINTTVNANADTLSAMQVFEPGIVLSIEGKAQDVKKSIVNSLAKSVTIDFISNGQFNLHELIEEIILKNGICLEATISAWAIKPEPARVICSLRDKLRLYKLNFIFDHRVKGQEADAMSIIEPKATKIVYKNIHAKVVLLRFEHLCVSIITSANFTKNTRIETGVVSTLEQTYNFHYTWMDKILN